MADVKLEISEDAIKATSRGMTKEVMEWVGAWWRDAIAHHVSIEGPPRSKPGEYPRVDTGEFHDNLYYRLYGRWGNLLEIASDAPHAEELEEIRPTFSRAFEEDWELFVREFDRLWGDG